MRPHYRFIVATLLLLCGIPLFGQVQPPDVPITHVSVTASFSGYDSNGHMVPATNDTLGLTLIRQSNGNTVNLAYQHIQIPSIGQRWEMGLLAYSGTVPKVKVIAFDTSNFVYVIAAGAGKFLSSVGDGNHLAWTVSGSLNYPIAAHMGWQVINYQYVRALGTHDPISGVVSSSQVSTGPVIYF